MIPSLDTERLILRALEPERDALFILELMNEPAFIDNVADRGVRTIADATAYISDKLVPSYAEFGFGFYKVELRASGEPIGICGLIKRDTLADIDIGFSLLTRYAGNGFAYEAASAVLAYARNHLALCRIVAITAPHNTRSARLLEKLGLHFETMLHVPGYGTESRLFAINLQQ